jgi:hypothetical protein
VASQWNETLEFSFSPPLRNAQRLALIDDFARMLPALAQKNRMTHPLMHPKNRKNLLLDLKVVDVSWHAGLERMRAFAESRSRHDRFRLNCRSSGSLLSALRFLPVVPACYVKIKNTDIGKTITNKRL